MDVFASDGGLSNPNGMVFKADICECDLNIDGKCDMQDWLLFGEDWGRTDCPSTTTSDVVDEVDFLKRKIKLLKAKIVAKDKEIDSLKGK